MQTRQVTQIPFNATEKAKDYTLLQQIQGGSQEAFNRLVDRYKNRLFNLVVRMIPTREEAEDIVQETFLRVYQHKNNFDPKYCFSTWIYTIALNLAKNKVVVKRLSSIEDLGSIEVLCADGEVIPSHVRVAVRERRQHLR